MARSKRYTIDEVRAHMDAYIDASAERLRASLRRAWKKQSRIGSIEHDKASV